MHIPDGFVSGTLNAATFLTSGIVGGIALRATGRTLEDRRVPLLGTTAAFIFAAQMLNFPIAAGTSGHFCGAALASIVLGPLAGFLVMGIVLTIQCLGFADGGLTALGSNLFNMGLLGGFGGYGIFLIVRRILPAGRAGFLAASAAASWSSIVFAAFGCASLLALSGTSPWHLVVPAMVGIHAVIGVGEALIATIVLSMILGVRPDLLPDEAAIEAPALSSEVASS